MTGRDITLAGKRILIVEDEYFIAHDICDFLRECGADIVGPACRLEQGITLAQETKPLDFAVLDVNLAGKSAVAIARTLKDRDIPFMFLTGYDAGFVAEEFFDAPCITKPFDGNKLCQTIRSQISAYHSRP